jgi:CheY-like chemotaxis protein
VRDAGDRCVLRIAVSDNGVGIPGKQQSAIFHAFTQVDGSHARRFGGTGVGLAIASRIVSLMGGELRVSSQVGRGSLFWFTVPVEKVGVPGEAPLPLPPPAEAPRAPAAKPLHVLLAEDNRINQKVAVRALERCGHRVSVVDDGARAVDAVREQSFDCVLMDLQMPGMDGTEATRAIRAREQDTGEHLHIIALTANVMEGDRESCLAAGMDDYLGKPLKLNELEAALRRVIEKRDARWPAPETSAA